MLATQGQRVDSVDEREGRNRNRYGDGELRPGGQPHESLPERFEEPPGSYLQPIHQARNGVELARDHGESEDSRTQAQDRQPAEEGAYHDEHAAAEDVGQAYEVEGAAPPPATLVKPVALPEAQPCCAPREVVPTLPDALDHSFTPTFGLTILEMLARGSPGGLISFAAPILPPATLRGYPRRPSVTGTLRNVGPDVTEVSPYCNAKSLECLRRVPTKAPRQAKDGKGMRCDRRS